MAKKVKIVTEKQQRAKEHAERAEAESREPKLSKEYIDKVREDNKGLDPLDPAAGLKLKLPTSSKRLFLHKAEVFGIEGRDGSGPCRVLKGPVPMPCGDMAMPNDTFDPVVERMPYGVYARLVARKFITPAEDKYVTKLVGRSGSTKDEG